IYEIEHGLKKDEVIKGDIVDLVNEKHNIIHEFFGPVSIFGVSFETLYEDLFNLDVGLQAAQTADTDQAALAGFLRARRWKQAMEQQLFNAPSPPSVVLIASVSINPTSATGMTIGSSRTFAITNSGNASTGPLTVSISGTNASAFTISFNTCSGTSLAPGAS